MKMRLLLLAIPAGLLALWACQMGAPSAATRSSPVEDLVLAAPQEEATVDFNGNAFPPTLPRDPNHSGAWEREDCLLCHENAIHGAPLVQHAGWSEVLLEARCRSCHVPGPDPAFAEPEPTFLRHAFPPTLPDDRDHMSGWLRQDCMVCHRKGVGQAPRVVHEGMSRLLLSARCRSCHVPRVAAGLVD